MNSIFEILYARRPALNYLSPYVCEVNFSGSGSPVIVLGDFPNLVSPGNVHFGGFGNFHLQWNGYPGAVCYSVYRDDAGVLTLIAECIPDPDFPVPPGCYRVTAITLDGETDFSPPVCYFSPPMIPPEVETDAATLVAATVATLNGVVNPVGQNTTAQFEWGQTLGYGNLTVLQNLGSSFNDFSINAQLAGLNPNTLYHFRAIASNASGIGEGDDFSFTTPNGGGGFLCPEFTTPPIQNVLILIEGDVVTLGPIPYSSGSGAGSLIFEWLKNGVVFENTTATTQNSLDLPALSTDDSALYTLRISNDEISCDRESLPLSLAVISEYWKYQNNLIDSVQGEILLQTGLGTLGFSAGKIGAAVRFTGSGNDSVILQTAAGINFAYNGDGLSLAGWFNIAGSTGSDVGFGIMQAIWNSVTLSDFSEMIIDYSTLADSFHVEIFSSSQGSISIDVPNIFGAGWHFVVVWYDVNDGLLRVQFDNGIAYVSGATIFLPAYPTGSGYFRQIANASPPCTYDFLVDEVLVLQSVITADTRDYLWNSGAGRTYPF